MADLISREKRSWNMSRIRSKDTKPELIVRSIIHGAGFRFTVNGPLNKSLPGKPDIVLPKYKTVIFVNGCFWHGHEGCPQFTIPKTRTEWWKNKINATKLRDQKNTKALERMGWKVLVIWECQLSTKKKSGELAQNLMEILSE